MPSKATHISILGAVVARARVLWLLVTWYKSFKTIWAMGPYALAAGGGYKGTKVHGFQNFLPGDPSYRWVQRYKGTRLSNLLPGRRDPSYRWVQRYKGTRLSKPPPWAKGSEP